jgi:hypothetical protein
MRSRGGEITIPPSVTITQKQFLGIIMNEIAITHWQRVARNWKYFGPPLRPAAADVDLFEKLVHHECARHNCKISTLLCGVTPEIASMNWPSNAFVIALEQSQEMIREVWPGDIDEKRIALHGSWLDAPYADRGYGIAIGDGCFISMNYPDGYEALAQKLKSSLDPNGLLLMRFFVQPDKRESSQQVIADLKAGKIGSFHSFKWRLAMSLQVSSELGVRLHDIFMAWEQTGIDTSWLMEKTGWSNLAIDTISLYKQRENRFHFATASEIERTLGSHFTQESIHYLEYELGDRCPIIAFRARSPA